MQKLLLMMMIASLAFVLACANAPEQPNTAANAPATKPAAAANKDDHTDDAPRITLAEAKKDFDAGNAVFIDTRGPDNYKQEHVKGAINITTAELATKADTIPKGKKIIAYCS
jgi:3-mercaptopyruvate sulfurtransferase SseA